MTQNRIASLLHRIGVSEEENTIYTDEFLTGRAKDDSYEFVKANGYIKFVDGAARLTRKGRDLNYQLSQLSWTNNQAQHIDLEIADKLKQQQVLRSRAAAIQKHIDAELGIKRRNF